MKQVQVPDLRERVLLGIAHREILAKPRHGTGENVTLTADLHEVEGLRAYLAVHVEFFAVEILCPIHDFTQSVHLLLHDDKVLDVDAVSEGAENLEELLLVLLRLQRRVDCLDVDLHLAPMLIEILQIFEIACKVDADSAGLLIARRIETLHGDVDVRDARLDECPALFGRQQQTVRDDLDTPCNLRIHRHAHVLGQT